MTHRFMRLFLIPLSCPAAICAAAVADQVGTAKAAADAVNFVDSHATRQVDCGGGDLAVSGSDDVLTVRNCNTISVLGSRNRLSAYLLRTSTIATIGNHNHVVFEDEPGFDPQVSSTGTDNEIVPQMSDKDMQPSAPIRLRAKAG